MNVTYKGKVMLRRSWCIYIYKHTHTRVYMITYAKRKVDFIIFTIILYWDVVLIRGWFMPSSIITLERVFLGISQLIKWLKIVRFYRHLVLMPT